MPTTKIAAAGVAQPCARSDEYFSPEASSSERWIALAIFVVCCLYFRLFYDYTLLNADEGILLQGAQRILEGQVLYRDFFSYFTPGSFYWLALLFKVFGSSFLVARTALIVVGGVLSVLTYLLARRVCSRGSALLAAYLVTLTCLPFRFVVLHNWDSTLLASLTIFCCLLLLERGHAIWVFGTGSLLSLTTLFEHSKGVGLAAGLFAGLLVVALRGQSRGMFGVRKFAVLCAGLTWPFAVTFAYFASKHSLFEMISDWLWPLHHYSVANKLPYGYLVMSTMDRGAAFSGSWGARLFMAVVLGPCYLLPVLPILAGCLFVWLALKRRPNATSNQKWVYGVVVSAALTGLLLSTLLTTRPDFTHLNYLAPLFYLVVAWSLGGLKLHSPLWRSLRPAAVSLLLLSFSAFGLAMLWGPIRAHHEFQTARGTIRTGEPDRALEFLQAHSSPGELILIHPYEPLYYYLTATFSPTRFDYLQPGMHTPEQFQEMVRELNANHVSLVLLEPSFNEKLALGWPSTPAGVLAARDPVTDYLLMNYRPCAELAANGYWHFVAMVPKEGSCPGGEADGGSKR
jgi:hypothetical protein